MISIKYKRKTKLINLIFTCKVNKLLFDHQFFY